MNGLTPLLASAHGWHDGDAGWWIVFPILWFVLLATALALLWRAGVHRHGGDQAKRILGERFARGEIGADEYRERLAQLR